MKPNSRLFSAGALVFALAAGVLVTTNGKAVSAIIAVVSCSSTAACTGGSNASTGPGVQGTSKGGHGVLAATTFNSTNNTNGESAVLGQDLSTSGIFDMGIQGTSVRGYGVRGKSTSNAGVRGDSTSGYGVQATSASSNAVFGLSTNSIGVAGQSTNYLGVYGIGPTYGVYGSGTTGYGAVGVSSNVGVYGSGTNYGVYGTAGNGKGVFGSSGSGQAVFAQSSTGRAFEGHTSSGLGLYITNGSGNGGDIAGSYAGLIARSDTFPLVLTTSTGANLFYVDGAGNVFYHGQLGHFANIGGATVVTSYTQSTAPAMEETGTARLVFGQATVPLSASFARTADLRRGYQVFLTPGGDTRGLYVAAKYAGGFTVREVASGRGTLYFDYHVYASAPTTLAPQAVTAPPRAVPLQLGAPIPPMTVRQPQIPPAPH